MKKGEMMANRIIYKSHFELFEKLEDTQLAQIIRKIGNSQYKLTDPVSIGVWLSMERDFLIQQENYQKVVERNRENGKKGGRPRLENGNPTKPNITQNNRVGYLETQENPRKPTETQHNPENLKDRDKDIVITSEEVITNYSNPDFSSLGGYGKFLGNFPPQKVREIELGKQKWDIFSQEEKQEIFRHSTKYIQQMSETGQVKYMKNSLKYLEDEPWLQMNARTFVSKPVERGMINHTLINFYSKEQGIGFDEAQKFLYRSSTDKEYSEAYSRYKKTTHQLFNKN